MPPTLEDIEVTANLFRLARTGRYQKVEELKVGARELMPGISEEQLYRGIKGLAERLWESDHGDYRDSFLRPHRL